jgi:phage terminase small subunit
MGPALRAIEAKQRAFVVAFIERGDENATAAARAAGYGSSSPTPEQANGAAKTAAWRLMHDEKILEAIKELASDQFRLVTFKAASVMLEIMNDPSHKDRFRAAERILAQNGMGVAVEVNHNHRVNLDEKGMIDRIARLAKDQGLDPRKLLGTVGVDYVDAEFEVISDPNALTGPAEPAMSSAGLEDLL